MSIKVQKIGDYVLGGTLGVGSFGKVRVAEHVFTHQKVAVKILNRRKLRIQQMEEKIKREIKIMKACAHPHIVRIYEVMETPAEILVVIEFSAGELFDFIVERGRLSEQESRRFFQQIIAAVEYCHKHSIAHRDLKPENILLDERNNVKITDFGLSNTMRDGWFLRTSCGSPQYAAPEVISAKLYDGPEVDVWSCGVTLYALLCGSLPFEEESYPRLFAKIKRGMFVMPSYLSDACQDLIKRMLAVDPLRRITIEEIRKHPWFMVDLPRYIAQPETVSTELEVIDQSTLERAAKLSGFPVKAILRSLQRGRRNRCTAVYHILKDTQLNLDTRVASESITTASLELMKSAGLYTNRGSSAYTDRSTAMEETPLLRDRRLFEGVHGQNGFQHKPIRSMVPFRPWNIGVYTSQSNPMDVMNSIYRALETLKWRWKTPSQADYHIRALMLGKGRSEPLRIALQLYKMNDGFQLDIQKLAGDTMIFCITCSDLLRELDSCIR